MECNIDSFKSVVQRRIDLAAKQLGYVVELGQYSRLGAQARAADTNNLLGFNGVYSARNGNGTWGVFKQLDAINIQAQKEFELQSRLERSVQTPDEQLFQLEIDNNRKDINVKLEKFIKEMLRKLGVSIRNLEEFKLRYKERTGKDVSLISVADLFENIVYVANDKRDGTTLTEESLHFIVDMFWDNPLIQDILTLSTNGETPDYKNTEVYKEVSQSYKKIYKGDQTKIDKEVITKLLTRTIYDQFYKKSTGTKMLSFLERVLRLFLGRVFRNIRLTREILPEGITEQLNQLLDRKVTEVQSDTFQSGLNPRAKTEGEVIVPESNFSEKALREIITYLTSRKNSYIEELTGLYDEVLKNRAKELTDKLGDKKLKEYLELLTELKNKPTLTPIEEERLNELKEIINLIKLDARDKSNMERAKKIDKSLLVLNNQIKKHNFEAGIFMFFFGPDGTGEGGAIEDIDAIMDAIKRIKEPDPEKPIIFDLEMYARIVQSASVYGPIIKTLDDLYKNGFNFEELSVENNKKLKETLSTLKVDKFDNIERFLALQTSTQIRNTFEEYKDVNPELKYRLKDEVIKLHNSGIVAYWWGAAQNAKEDMLGIFNKIIFDTQNKIHRMTNQTGIELWKKIEGKKVNYKKLMRGSYWLNPYDIQKWENAREAAYKTIIEKAEAYSRSKGFNVKIPLNSELRDELFAAASFEASENLTPYQIHIKNLHAFYNKQWALWFNKNTQIHPNLEEIIERKRLSMNQTQFEYWKSKNIKTTFIMDESGEIVEDTYYVGELSVPSSGRNGTNDYTDSEYEKLKTQSPEEFEVLNILKEQHLKALEKVPGYKSYELMNRLPQITQTFSDIAFRGFRDVKGIGDKITDTFLDKEDDPLHAHRENILGENHIVDRPIVKFISKLKEPSTISSDLFRTVLLLTEMSNNYSEFMVKLPELNGMIEVVKRAERVNPVSGNKKDYLLDKMIQLKEKNVLGETYSTENKRMAKILQSLRNYIVSRNLKGNMVSVMVGYVSGQIESWIEKFLGTHIDTKTSAFKEFGKQSLQMLKDFNSPVKHSKAAIIMQDIGLLDTIEYTFGNTNENAILRGAGKLLDWGAWRVADLVLKGEAMVNVASDLRFINGKMYSSSKWKKFIETNPERTMEEYNNAKSMYDSIKTNNGKIEYEPYVKQEDIDLFTNKVKVLASRLDSQPLNIDKAAAASSLLLQFSTVHTGWLFQMIERGFKGEHFNYLTQEQEVGWWRVFYDLGLWNPAKWPHIKYIYSQSTPQEQEAIKRLLLMSASLSLTFATAYVMVAASLGDDDGEDSSLQYASYVMSRALMEQEARLSLGDIIRYLESPFSGVKLIDNYFSLIALPIRLMTDGSDVVEDGIYEGYTKTQKDLIKSIPMLRGWFETMYGGYINEALGKPAVHVGISLKDKNDYIKNQLINQTSVYSPLSLPLGLPVKAVTKFTVAQPIASALTDYPKSSGAVNLPTKKANKED